MNKLVQAFIIVADALMAVYLICFGILHQEFPDKVRREILFCAIAGLYLVHMLTLLISK